MTILRKEYVVGNAGATVPGAPGSPGSPAYCLDVPVTIAPTYTFITLPDPNNPGQIEIIPVTNAPVTVIAHECFSAVDGTPATPDVVVASTQTQYFVGWNAGATSIDTLSGDGIYQFSFNNGAVGVVTGFNDNNTGAGYAEILYGIYGASNQFQVVESGATMTSPAPFVGTDVFSIVRLGGLVMYFQNNTLVYQSSVYSDGTIFVDASLYFGGDEVDQ